jgi:hypothetical protein
MTAKKSSTVKKSPVKNAQRSKNAAKNINIRPSIPAGGGEDPVGTTAQKTVGAGRASSIPDIATRIIDETSSLLKEEIGGAGLFNPLDRRVTGKSAAGTPVGIVSDAANILSEEITRGFDTAKKVGEKMGDVNAGSRLDDMEVIQQFRSQAHSAVDVMINLVNLAANPANGLTGQFFTGSGDAGTGAAKSEGTAAAAGIPCLSISKVTRPGSKVTVQMTLENEGDTRTERFNLVSTDLQNLSGDRITSDNVSFRPASATIEPRESLKVEVVIDVPGDTPSGVYSGLLQATRLETMRAVISVNVE